MELNETGGDSFVDLNKTDFLPQRCRATGPGPSGGVRPAPNVSQPTCMLTSCTNELPSVFLSFRIDIPAAASACHSHSSARVESSPTSSSEKTCETLNGPTKSGPKAL